MRKCGVTGFASCSLACPVPQSTTLLGPPVPALPRVLSARLPISAPPTGLDECFFNSLVVGDPCSLNFWQFWLFIVFKLVVILRLVVGGGDAFLHMSPILAETPKLEQFEPQNKVILDYNLEYKTNIHKFTLREMVE